MNRIHTVKVYVIRVMRFERFNWIALCVRITDRHNSIEANSPDTIYNVVERVLYCPRTDFVCNEN